MFRAYRIHIVGNPELDFTVGTQHRIYGDVLDIKETVEEMTYDGDSCPSSFGCVIKVVFKDKEIVFNANNPLMVVYREERK